MAYGIDATIDGTKIDLDSIVNTTIGIRFSIIIQDGSQQIDFKDIEDSTNKKSETSNQDSRDQASQW